MAEHNVAVASRDLAQAKANLEHCMNNSDRSNCNREGRIWEVAQQNLSIALDLLKAAQLEVQQAQLEVQQAKARVAACQQAVGYSQQAVTLAQQSQQSAEDAVGEGELSVEYARAGQHQVEHAHTTAGEGIVVAEQMVARVRVAESALYQAQSQFSAAEQSEMSGQLCVSDGGREIAYRIERLYALDRPTLPL